MFSNCPIFSFPLHQFNKGQWKITKFIIVLKEDIKFSLQIDAMIICIENIKGPKQTTKISKWIW